MLSLLRIGTCPIAYKEQALASQLTCRLTNFITANVLILQMSHISSHQNVLSTPEVLSIEF